MAEVVRQALWDGEVTRSGRFDKIMVQKLEVTVNAGKDAWGRPKVQRAQISVTVTLNEQFGSAADTDTVDGSTIHYGTLSKALQADLKSRMPEWASTQTLAGDIINSVSKVAGQTPIYALEVDICYVKGSMFGDGAGVTASRIMQDSRLHSNVLYLRSVRIPCLVGVNSNERLQKQPVVLNIWIDCVHDSRTDDYGELESFLFTVRLCDDLCKLS
jgi:dihydroneopterin aldolase